MNQTDVSNTNNLFTPPITLTTPSTREENQPEQDFYEAVENEFIQENCALLRALKQGQHQ